MDKYILFTSDQGNLLVRIMIAHLISDFLLQNKKMVESKKWFTIHMLIHITIVFASTIIMTQNWSLSLIITVIHYLIDGLKKEIERKKVVSELFLFLIDQSIHIITIVLIWTFYFNIWEALVKAIMFPFIIFKISLIILGYLFIMEPISHIIRYTTKSMIQSTFEDSIENQHGGKRIGIFERIIILTFVLLGQYAAIGFLITGKSIIRYADKNSDLKSEYVLVGTMMSYAFAILTGVLINWILKGY
jgi:Protein of unknown function (DUF3307)